MSLFLDLTPVVRTSGGSSQNFILSLRCQRNNSTIHIHLALSCKTMIRSHKRGGSLVNCVTLCSSWMTSGLSVWYFSVSDSGGAALFARMQRVLRASTNSRSPSFLEPSPGCFLTQSALRSSFLLVMGKPCRRALLHLWFSETDKVNVRTALNGEEDLKTSTARSYSH